jgi:hypothetical protein
VPQHKGFGSRRIEQSFAGYGETCFDFAVDGVRVELSLVSSNGRALCKGTVFRRWRSWAMSPNDQSVLDLLALAEAELAVLKQEHILRHLVDTGEPTKEARELLAKLREAVAKLTIARTNPGDDRDKAA